LKAYGGSKEKKLEYLKKSSDKSTDKIKEAAAILEKEL